MTATVTVCQPPRTQNHRRSVRASAPAAGPAPAACPARRTPCTCSQCSLHETCLPAGLAADDLARIDHLTQRHQRVLRYQTLYQTGDPFTALYAVRAGFFRSERGSGDARDPISGFRMAGELIGLDGIATGRHTCSAVALEDSEVCVIPFEEMETLARSVPALQRNLLRLMSREVVQGHRLQALLANGDAGRRVSGFLVDLSCRLSQRGYAASEFVLRMTREEIGRHLGLTLETVSRALSQLQREGSIRVRHRLVHILDAETLARHLPD